MRGDKPKPTSKIIPKNPIGNAPSHLPQVAKVLYRKLAKDLAENVSSLDVCALAAFCMAYARWVEAEKIVTQEGIQTEGKPNPAVKVAESMLRQLRYWGGELGLSPLARGRIQSEPVEVVDPLENFLDEGGA